MGISALEWKNRDGQKLIGKSWQPEGTPKAVIVLIHGLGEHCGRYEHVAAFFNHAGLAVISYDQRGHGLSEGPRGHAASYDALCDDIQHFLDEAVVRFPKIPVFLYGHSLGGALALYFTLKRKPALKGVICTSPGLATFAPVAGGKLLAAKVMNVIFPTFTLPNDLDLNYLSHDPQIKAAYISDPLVHDRVSARLGMELLTNGQYCLAHASEFPLPLLLLQGSEDRLVNPPATEKFAQKAPRFTTFKKFDGDYHELHNETNKQVVLAEELAWINLQLAVH